MVSLWKSRCEWEDDFPSANFLTSKQGKWEWWCGERVLGEFWWETNSWKPANLPYPFKKWRWWWSLCWPLCLRWLKAFTLESSNRIYIKIIDTNPPNTPYQSCQTAVREKFFYSSSFKWSSHCSSANLILPFKYSFFSLLHLVWRALSLNFTPSGLVHKWCRSHQREEDQQIYPHSDQSWGILFQFFFIYLMIRVKFCCIVVMGMIPDCVCGSTVYRRVVGSFRVGFGGFGSRGFMIGTDFVWNLFIVKFIGVSTFGLYYYVIKTWDNFSE